MPAPAAEYSVCIHSLIVSLTNQGSTMHSISTGDENIIRLICLVLTAIAYCVAYTLVLSFITAALGFWLTLLVNLITAALSYYFADIQLQAGNYVATKLGDAAVPAYMAIRGFFTKKSITA